MSIAYIIPTVQSAQAFFIPLFKKLIDRGISVYLFTNKTKSEKYVWFEELPAQLNVVHIEIPRTPLSTNLYHAVKRIKKHLPEELLFIHGHFFMGCLIASLLKDKNRIICTSLHGLVEDDFALIKRKTIQLLEKTIAKRSDVLWLFNAHDYKKFAAFKSVRILPGFGMGVDLKRFEAIEQFKQNKSKYLEKWGLPENKNIFLYTGRLIHTKGIRFLIDAFKSIPNAHLLLCGSSDSAHDEIKLDILKNVTVIGWQNDLRPLMAICDAYVTASYREAIAVGVMEAIICGLPVICPPTKGIVELVEHEKNGYIFSNISVEGVIEGVNYFNLNKEKLTELATSKKEDVSFDYSREKSVTIQIDEYVKFGLIR